MRSKKNPTQANEVEIEMDHNADPAEIPPWYDQMLKLDSRQREQIRRIALERIKQSKPETYEFIKKFSCELVGFSPRVEYTLLKDSDGEIDVTWVHAYSMPTLVYWCEDGGFHFSVNANLKYNDTVLNAVDGNKIDRQIRGFTS